MTTTAELALTCNECRAKATVRAPTLRLALQQAQAEGWTSHGRVCPRCRPQIRLGQPQEDLSHV